MGTSFTNPIGRALRPRYNEASPLRSIRDQDVTPRVWQKNLDVEQQLFRACQAVEQLQRELNRLRRRGGSEEPGATPRDWFMGDYDSATQYHAQEMVKKTGVGFFICISDPPLSTDPETGSPYWVAMFSNVGVWSF